MVRTYPDSGESAPFVNYDKWTEDEEKRIRAEMTALAKRLKEKGLSVTWRLDAGTDAAHEIEVVSRKIGADLMVMSTHGRSGLGRLVFGSVTEKVLHNGENPLLLVRAGRVR